MRISVVSDYRNFINLMKEGSEHLNHVSDLMIQIRNYTELLRFQERANLIQTCVVVNLVEVKKSICSMPVYGEQTNSNEVLISRKSLHQ